MQVIRVLLSSTVLRRAVAGRPLPLLDRITVLKDAGAKVNEENVFFVLFFLKKNYINLMYELLE